MHTEVAAHTPCQTCPASPSDVWLQAELCLCSFTYACLCICRRMHSGMYTHRIRECATTACTPTGLSGYHVQIFQQGVRFRTRVSRRERGCRSNVGRTSPGRASRNLRVQHPCPQAHQSSGAKGGMLRAALTCCRCYKREHGQQATTITVVLLLPTVRRGTPYAGARYTRNGTAKHGPRAQAPHPGGTQRQHVQVTAATPNTSPSAPGSNARPTARAAGCRGSGASLLLQRSGSHNGCTALNAAQAPARVTSAAVLYDGAASQRLCCVSDAHCAGAGGARRSLPMLLPGHGRRRRAQRFKPGRCARNTDAPSTTARMARGCSVRGASRRPNA